MSRSSWGGMKNILTCVDRWKEERIRGVRRMMKIMSRKRCRRLIENGLAEQGSEMQNRERAKSIQNMCKNMHCMICMITFPLKDPTHSTSSRLTFLLKIISDENVSAKPERSTGI